MEENKMCGKRIALCEDGNVCDSDANKQNKILYRLIYIFRCGDFVTLITGENTLSVRSLIRG